MDKIHAVHAKDKMKPCNFAFHTLQFLSAITSVPSRLFIAAEALVSVFEVTTETESHHIYFRKSSELHRKRDRKRKGGKDTEITGAVEFKPHDKQKQAHFFWISEKNLQTTQTIRRYSYNFETRLSCSISVYRLLRVRFE